MGRWALLFLYESISDISSWTAASISMNSPEERILAYPHLSPEEKRRVEAYVEEHPKWGPLLQDVQALEELAHDVQRLDELPRGDEVLATYVVAQHLYSDAIPSSLREVFDRLEARMETDDQLRMRYEEVRSHLETLDAEFDPRSHFEQLTGHTLAQDAEAEESGSAEHEERDERPPSRTVREPAEPSRTPSERVSTGILSAAGRWAVAAVTVVAVAYGVLFLASRLSQDPLDRLASVEVGQDVLESYQVRTRSVAPAPGSTSVDQTYLQGLRALRGARTTTLGLFPRYDSEKLQRAERLLSTVAERAEDGSFLQLEALFYLGNVQLAQGDVEQARSNLKIVVQLEGRRAEEAYQTLKELQQEVAPQ